MTHGILKTFCNYMNLIEIKAIETYEKPANYS